MGGSAPQGAMSRVDQGFLSKLSVACAEALSRDQRFLRGVLMAVTVHLNGERRTTEAITLIDLIEELGLSQRMIAIECNLEVVPRSLYGQTELKEGDRIELVHMIGGG